MASDHTECPYRRSGEGAAELDLVSNKSLAPLQSNYEEKATKKALTKDAPLLGCTHEKNNNSINI